MNSDSIYVYTHIIRSYKELDVVKLSHTEQRCCQRGCSDQEEEDVYV